MGKIAQFFGLQESAAIDEGALATAEYRAEKLNESMAQMQLAMEDMGWEKLTGQFAQEFTRDGLERAAELSRTMAVANPLIKRGLAIRAASTDKTPRPIG